MCRRPPRIQSSRSSNFPQCHLCLTQGPKGRQRKSGRILLSPKKHPRQIFVEILEPSEREKPHRKSANLSTNLDPNKRRWCERTVRGLSKSKSRQDLQYAAYTPLRNGVPPPLSNAALKKIKNLRRSVLKDHPSKGSIVGLTPRQDWTRHFSVVPARRPGLRSARKKE